MKQIKIILFDLNVSPSIKLAQRQLSFEHLILLNSHVNSDKEYTLWGNNKIKHTHTHTRRLSSSEWCGCHQDPPSALKEVRAISFSLPLLEVRSWWFPKSCPLPWSIQWYKDWPHSRTEEPSQLPEFPWNWGLVEAEVSAAVVTPFNFYLWKTLVLLFISSQV